MNKNTSSPALDNLFAGNDHTLPQYKGLSIVNIADSICRWLDIPSFGMGPLQQEIIHQVEGPFQRIVLVLIDAVSYHHFKLWSTPHSTSGSLPFLQRGNLNAITSIAPSTTCAALTSLWTGQPACRHGISGYEMWMREYNMAVNMISHRPARFRYGENSLARAGFKPETFLPLPTLGTHLQAQNIPAHVFQHHSILHSGLSRTFLHEVERHGINTPADLWLSLQELLETDSGHPLVATAYWGAVDGYLHQYGPEDPRPEKEFAGFLTHLQKNFLDELSPQARKDTLLLITADHGQIATPRDPHYHLEQHPRLADMLHLLPSGENRLAYFHVRPGKVQEVENYIQETWPGKFHCIRSRILTEKGLFGPGPYHPRWYSRVGDLTVIAKDNAYLWWPAEENDMLGRHGGLSEQEMLVPFFSLPL